MSSSNPDTGQDGEHATFCRLCEAFCGLVATVENGVVTKVKPDRDNPHSQGHVCVKGMAFHQVTHDPDRILSPMRRVGAPGQFEPVSWDEALDDIADKLKSIHGAHGGDAIAFYIGNPTSFATDTAMSHGGFMKALGSRKGYSPGSQDSNARSVANFVVFGGAMINAFPDLPHCEFLLVLGANPLVSNGSILFSPRIRHDLDGIAERGRVVVVDPRATETARRYEHVQVSPNGDIWLLIGILCVLFENDLIDRDAVAATSIGLPEFEARIRRYAVEDMAARSGVSVEQIRDIAEAFATTGRAAAYSRVGLCRGPFATLANILVTSLNIVTGNFGAKRGGTIFGYPLLQGSDQGQPGGYAGNSTRVGGIPSVARYLASAAMPDDILEPGDDRARALFVTAGNPVLSAPGGARLEEALQSLDLMVAFDFYINETSRFADYVLPSTTFYERDDFPYVGFNILMRPFVQYTNAVIDPVGQSRHEHEVYRDIIRRMGLTWPARTEEERKAEEAGTPWRPIERIDHALRTGFAGDQYGARDGWSIERLRTVPGGVMVDLPDPTSGWQKRLGYPDGRLRLWHEMTAEEFDRLETDGLAPPELSLIGRRDIRSINSWMHNVDRLVRSQEAALLVSAEDAERYGLEQGGEARLWNDNGELVVEVAISDEVRPGVVCYPHGWGHRGSWQRANASPGKNINVLLGLGKDSVEFISGTTLMDGIPVSIEPLPAAETTEPRT